jgi:chromosome segregation ATPase
MMMNCDVHAQPTHNLSLQTINQKFNTLKDSLSLDLGYCNRLSDHLTHVKSRNNRRGAKTLPSSPLPITPTRGSLFHQNELIHELNSDKKQLVVELDIRNHEYQELRHEHMQCSSKLAAEQEKWQDDLAIVQHELQAKESQFTHLQLDNKQLMEKVKEYENEIKQLKQELSVLTGKLEDIKLQENPIMQHHECKFCNNMSMQLNMADKAYKRVRGELEDQKKENKKLHDRLKLVQDNLAFAQEDFEKAEHNLKHTKFRNRQLRRSLVSQSSERDHERTKHESEDDTGVVNGE